MAAPAPVIVSFFCFVYIAIDQSICGESAWALNYIRRLMMQCNTQQTRSKRTGLHSRAVL